MEEIEWNVFCCKDMWRFGHSNFSPFHWIVWLSGAEVLVLTAFWITGDFFKFTTKTGVVLFWIVYAVVYRYVCVYP